MATALRRLRAPSLTDLTPPHPSAPVKTRLFPTLQNACAFGEGEHFVCDLNKTSVVGGSGARGAAGFSFP